MNNSSSGQPPVSSQPADEHSLYSDHGDDNAPADTHDMLAARTAALSVLNMVLGQKQALDHALEREQGFLKLPTRDKAFCRMMISTCIRRLGQINDLIKKATHKNTPKTIDLDNILRLGIAQILFMDVPDHAAVDTSVRLTEALRMDKQKGFVNGVLRTITREGREWLSKQDESRLNTPEWLLKIWIADYGLRNAAEIAKANLAEAPLDISIKNESDRNFWQSTFKATQLGAGTLRCQSGGAIQHREGFEDGMWWVQDASAAIPARLFGPIEGRDVIDLCAAPGGKTMQLAAQGAQVVALDRSAGRSSRITQNLERTRLEDHVEIVIADATVWAPKQPADFILVDAPCSATGTIRRNPDVAHLKAPRDLSRLVNVQERILENAFNMLAPGGILIYCTCSLQKSEGEDQITALLQKFDNAERLPIKTQEIGNMDEPITADGDLRILPYHMAALGGMDGFFISRITKKA